MKKVYLENRGTQDGAECNKFFTLEDTGLKLIINWGSIGTKGQIKILSQDPDPVVRQAEWDKKFKEKTTRKVNPYVVISHDTDGIKNKVEARPPDVDTDRYWGLEIETHTNLDVGDIIARLKDRGLEINDQRSCYFHSTGQTWDVKRDGSCGYEFASSKLRGEAGIFDAKLAVEKIRVVCDTAVNRQCGIHVTVDVADHDHDDLKRLIIGYLKAQEHFYGGCAAWRQDNRYCKRNPVANLMAIIREGSIERALDLAGGWRQHDDRYHGLNLTRVFDPKVVEFRMLESSVDIRKVGAWIRACVGFVDGLKKSHVAFKTVSMISASSFKEICEGTWKP